MKTRYKVLLRKSSTLWEVWEGELKLFPNIEVAQAVDEDEAQCR